MEERPPIAAPSGDVSGAPQAPTGLKALASAQKLLLWSVAATLSIFVVPYLVFPVWAFQIWAAYNMGKTLNLSNAWLWVLGSMIPLLGILFLLRMNSLATLALQAAGVRVGLMGANASDLDKQA